MWEDDSTQVEKKSNLDVLDKRGWNVVIYAIETQMLTDVRASDPSAATASEFLGIPRCWGLSTADEAEQERSDHSTSSRSSGSNPRFVLWALLDQKMAEDDDNIMIKIDKACFFLYVIFKHTH
jgi:hypothetical protein